MNSHPPVLDAVSKSTGCTPQRKETLNEIVELAVEIAREGREGRRIGTLFVIGDVEETLARSRPLILDPLAGHPALAAARRPARVPRDGQGAGTARRRLHRRRRGRVRRSRPLRRHRPRRDASSPASARATPRGSRSAGRRPRPPSSSRRARSSASSRGQAEGGDHPRAVPMRAGAAVHAGRRRAARARARPDGRGRGRRRLRRSPASPRPAAGGVDDRRRGRGSPVAGSTRRSAAIASIIRSHIRSRVSRDFEQQLECEPVHEGPGRGRDVVDAAAGVEAAARDAALDRLAQRRLPRPVEVAASRAASPRRAGTSSRTRATASSARGSGRCRCSRTRTGRSAAATGRARRRRRSYQRRSDASPASGGTRHPAALHASRSSAGPSRRRTRPPRRRRERRIPSKPRAAMTRAAASRICGRRSSAMLGRGLTLLAPLPPAPLHSGSGGL